MPELNLGPQYRVLTVLAKGGMGAVYLGEMKTDSGDRRTVAIKVMHHHIAESPDTIAMFIDEARVGTRIVHPNVVRVLATEVVQETPFLVMEYVEGLSWSRLVGRAQKAGKVIPVDVAVRVVHDTLLGLHAAHELKMPNGEDAQVVHRDVSPQNILVGADGVVRITDFGVATFAGRLTSTAPGELRGKLGYIAPEQLQKGGVDRRSDVFAAGVVLWEALTGKRLFGADTQAETLARVLSEPIAPPSSHRHEVSLDLDEVCLRALERAKDRRYQTAAELAAALASAVPPADDARLVAFLTALAHGDLQKQRVLREEAQRNAGRWSAPDIALPAAPPAVEAEASVPKSYTGSIRPATPVATTTPRWARYAIGGAAAALLVVVGTMIGRMSSHGATEPPPITAPAPPMTEPTPPKLERVDAVEPTPSASSTASVVRKAPPKATIHKPPASASAHPPKPGDTRKYVPGEL